MDTKIKMPIHILFTSAYFGLALVTLIPTATASKASLLRYKALCSFTPISTLILIALGGLHIYLQNRKTVAN